MANARNGTRTFQDQVKNANSIQTLQVFNSGIPCGWLGKTHRGFWFHYSSNNPHQNWVSLLMPPTTNFYQKEDLFTVFAQHLPRVANDQPLLNCLHQVNGKHLGTLSFANPDNPVVQTPICVLPEALSDHEFPELQAGHCMLIRTHQRKSFGDTLVHHPSLWPLVLQLRDIKHQVDPDDRLRGLRWALNSQCSNHLLWHIRPDLNVYQQQLLGFESIRSVLNLGQDEYSTLAQRETRFHQVLLELVRTYCKNFAFEIQMMEALLPLLKNGQINASVVYSTNGANQSIKKPVILGMEYMPAHQF